jgi:hypothetical protein
MERPHQKPTLDGATAGTPGPGDRAYQDLWFALAPRPWSSLLLVPGDEETSADEVARRLAAIGKQLHPGPVTVVTVSSLDFGTASALGRLPGFLDQMQRESRQGPERAPFEMPPSHFDGPDQAGDGPGAGEAPSRRDGALRRIPLPGESERPSAASAAGARLIMSIPSVVVSPLGLATAQSADLVVLCVELGRTSVAGVRRTLDLIGRERVAGCFLVH